MIIMDPAMNVEMDDQLVNCIFRFDCGTAFVNCFRLYTVGTLDTFHLEN